jgi:hypothetical protein
MFTYDRSLSGAFFGTKSILKRVMFSESPLHVKTNKVFLNALVVNILISMADFELAIGRRNNFSSSTGSLTTAEFSVKTGILDFIPQQLTLLWAKQLSGIVRKNKNTSLTKTNNFSLMIIKGYAI